MATQDHEVTGTPVDIVAALSLRVGTRYGGQVVTRDVVVHLREAATAPDGSDPAHIIVPREPFTIKPDAGMGVYLWTAAGGPATVVLTEAP